MNCASDAWAGADRRIINDNRVFESGTIGNIFGNYQQAGRADVISDAKARVIGIWLAWYQVRDAVLSDSIHRLRLTESRAFALAAPPP